MRLFQILSPYKIGVLITIFRTYAKAIKRSEIIAVIEGPENDAILRTRQLFLEHEFMAAVNRAKKTGSRSPPRSKTPIARILRRGGNFKDVRHVTRRR